MLWHGCGVVVVGDECISVISLKIHSCCRITWRLLWAQGHTTLIKIYNLLVYNCVQANVYGACCIRPCLRRLTRSTGNWPVKYDRRRTAEGPVGAAAAVINWVSVRHQKSECAYTVVHGSHPVDQTTRISASELFRLGGGDVAHEEPLRAYVVDAVSKTSRSPRAYPVVMPVVVRGRGSPWTYVLL